MIPKIEVSVIARYETKSKEKHFDIVLTVWDDFQAVELIETFETSSQAIHASELLVKALNNIQHLVKTEVK